MSSLPIGDAFSVLTGKEAFWASNVEIHFVSYLVWDVFV
jgi:hypothetical protein